MPKNLSFSPNLFTLFEFVLFRFQFIFNQQFVIVQAVLIFFKILDSLQGKQVAKQLGTA